MPHTSYRQPRAGSSSTSSDYEDLPDPWGDDMSELSELESESESTPDTENEVREEPPNEHEDRMFKLRQPVLVKPRGCREWYAGVVTKIREPSKEHNRPGRLYVVVFRRYRTNIRDAFSPLDGSIRPDTPQLRSLLLGSYD
ncbi:hypothetical protein K466DRAFT_600964 [Polyporus arcularius HHB13444]|uniref:Uncharacterized protein n=2 Tax=Polyporaceae TaxID=5317 RepID=A0A5C3P880_9APHY|nr:hypothetical protein OH76DRAFT_1417253 [Polyporus brumalis]TFK85691.1 hypothetical protein K466DRAFT_600964 [Polyporus arcularius HHB13444]